MSYLYTTLVTFIFLSHSLWGLSDDLQKVSIPYSWQYLEKSNVVELKNGDKCVGRYSVDWDAQPGTPLYTLYDADGNPIAFAIPYRFTTVQSWWDYMTQATPLWFDIIDAEGAVLGQISNNYRTGLRASTFFDFYASDGTLMGKGSYKGPHTGYLKESTEFLKPWNNEKIAKISRAYGGSPYVAEVLDRNYFESNHIPDAYYLMMLIIRSDALEFNDALLYWGT